MKWMCIVEAYHNNIISFHISSATITQSKFKTGFVLVGTLQLNALTKLPSQNRINALKKDIVCKLIILIILFAFINLNSSTQYIIVKQRRMSVWDLFYLLVLLLTCKIQNIHILDTIVCENFVDLQNLSLDSAQCTPN